MMSKFNPYWADPFLEEASGTGKQEQKYKEHIKMSEKLFPFQKRGVNLLNLSISLKGVNLPSLSIYLKG